MQLKLNDSKLTVWQNGKDLVKDFDTTNGHTVADGFLVMLVNDPGLQLRNMRIKSVQQ